MAVRIARSMTEELIEGATDTSVGKPDGPDRLNSPYTNDTARNANAGGWYGQRSYVNPRAIIRGIIRGT